MYELVPLDDVIDRWRMAVERVIADIDAEVALEQHFKRARLDFGEQFALEAIEVVLVVAVPQVGELLFDDEVEGIAERAAVDVLDRKSVV